MPSSPNDRNRDDSEAALLAETLPGDNAAPFTVSEISGALKREVEGRFGHVRVRGEISGFKRAPSGHCYLALKDDRAVLDAVLWKGQAGRLPFAPEDGLEVIATGKLTTYPGRSKYQLVVERLEVAGEGALMQLLEARRRALAAEGLFAEDRKKRLPYLPKTIGVVTSPAGAVIRDILHRLADRMPSHVLVWPVIVQGEGAAEQVARAIRGFDAIETGGPIARPDLVIVARGGGSIEDLWAFNEETVVRAVADCAIPLISAVGHETDTTLCDFAADVRAPTPTAAAEIAVPVRAELLASLMQGSLRAGRAVRRLHERLTERLTALARLLPRRESLFAPQARRVDELAERLRPGLLARRAGDARDRLAGLARLLEQLHPDKPLEKGYARVSARSGATIAGVSAAREAEALTLHFADGQVDARVEERGGAAYAEPKAKRPVERAPEPGQPGLFD